MAAYGWGKDHSVANWLFDEGYRFDFFQAVRLLEMRRPWCDSVGRGTEPHKEAVRFKSAVGINFPANDIDDITRRSSKDYKALAAKSGATIRPKPRDNKLKDKSASMTVNFMGLAGCLGPLDMPVTESILEGVWYKDESFKDFLDIFNHRLVSILYRIRQIHRIGLEHKPPGQDGFSKHLFSLIGLGTPGLRARMHIRDRALLYYAGLIGQQPHSMIGLEQILADYFQVPVRGKQFCGEWYDLEESQWSRIGRRGQNQRLGHETVVLGKRIWDQQAKFEIVLGPLTLKQFVNFLPHKWGFKPLCDLTRFYAGDEFDFGFRLVLKASEVPKLRLSTKRAGARLGWTAWLRSETPKLSLNTKRRASVLGWTAWQRAVESWMDWIPVIMQRAEDDSQVTITPESHLAIMNTMRIPLFGVLPPDVLSELIDKMIPHHLKKHSVVVRQGEPGDSMFVIKNGEVKVTRRDADGKETHLTNLGEGECFGEMALLTGKVRNATVVTVKDCTILELKKNDFEIFRDKNRRLERALEGYAETRTAGLR